MPRQSLFDQLREKVGIDKYLLDDEVQSFPEIFYQVCEQEKIADALVNELRVERLQIEASLQEKGRDVLTERNQGKATVGAINSWVRGRTRYRRADKAYQDAKAAHGRWAALKEAMQAKSYKLRDLVDLHIAHYYSDPAASGDGSTTKRRRLIRNATKSK